MNKTKYFLDVNIIEVQNNDDNKYTFAINPYEVTPSFMFKPSYEHTLSIALRFSNLDSQWSKMVLLNVIDGLGERKEYSLIQSNYKQ